MTLSKCVVKLLALAMGSVNGYRADDSYISVIEIFFKNQLSVDEVERMFRQGNMGQQVFIKSPKAFEALRFVGAERLTENKYFLEHEENKDNQTKAEER